MTFIKACKHITNYSSAHESLSTRTGEQRLNYPGNHIEADNRLSWLLGRLDDAYGDSALYVHLCRNLQDNATSFSKRRDYGIIKAYEKGILMRDDQSIPAYDIALDYLDTVNSNINLFLKGKPNVLEVSLETITTDFTVFWKRINATGSLSEALKEWEISYNAS